VNNLIEQNTLLELFRGDDISEEIILYPQCLKSDDVKINEICFFKVDRLTFDEEYPHREAFENVLQALDNNAFNFVYILSGDANGIGLYIGVLKNQNENFGGSQLKKLTSKNLTDVVFDSVKQFKNAGVILGIPSVKKKNNDDKGFQGIDRLINSMLGLKWRLVVVCEPVAKSEVAEIRNNIYEIYNKVSPYAHRLLSRVEFGDNGSKRTAVETFTDLLAEVRKYGESLIVVDQIPNKLAPEVLKNTNTKIIHRLFARDDKEAVGDTMLMDDKQKEFLSALETGQAIVFSEGMEHPVHVKIQPVTDTSDSGVSNEIVKARFIKFFGEQHRRAELVQKFYQPARELLTKLACSVTANQHLSEETLTLVDKFKLNAARFFEAFDFDEEPTEFLAYNLLKTN